MAFIIDIRRGNLHLHLMYKALFEAADRADFLSRLFSRPRPEGLTASSARGSSWPPTRYDAPSALYDESSRDLEDAAKRHGFNLPTRTSRDRVRLRRSSRRARRSSTRAPGGRGGRYPTYTDLQMARPHGGAGAYLASEDNFHT